MSCGISTSFPVLSPIRRQVAHALLTRPPLFRFRRSFTVRLECVMHAASVHPEPGSNSRTNCISTVSGQHQVCRACGSFYFLSMHPVLSGCVSKNDEIFALASFLLVLKSPVVQLSMINRGSDSVLAFPLPVLPWLSRGQLIYYITFASTCQEVFKTFFKKVLNLSFGRRLLVPFRKAC